MSEYIQIKLFSTVYSIGPGDGLDLSGTGMSTPHISHLASTNPFSILSPSPQPTSSQSSTIDVHTISGLRNVNIQLPSGRKDNHDGKCEVRKYNHKILDES